MGVIQIALIRGINVGKAKRVAMSDLRELTEELGYECVRTILNSGNIVFIAQDTDTTTSAKCIEQALLIRTNITAKVTVLTKQELDKIINNNPFDQIATDPSHLIIAVYNSTENRERILHLEQRSWGKEAFVISERAAYLWCPNGVHDSPLMLSVNQALGECVTSRNWATLLRINANITKLGLIEMQNC